MSLHHPDSNPKTRVGITKAPMHLVPSVPIIHESLAFADGAAKYGPFNWRDEPVSSSVYLAAAKRHLDAWFDGEDFAADSGVHHLAHVRACMAILLDAEAAGTLNDDRPTPGGAAALLGALQNR